MKRRPHLYTDVATEVGSQNPLAFSLPYFDPEAYWADKPIKKYVCAITAIHKGQKQFETRYSASRNAELAKAHALSQTFLLGRKTVFVRLATPTDLGCVPVQSFK